MFKFNYTYTESRILLGAIKLSSSLNLIFKTPSVVERLCDPARSRDSQREIITIALTFEYLNYWTKQNYITAYDEVISQTKSLTTYPVTEAWPSR